MSQTEEGSTQRTDEIKTRAARYRVLPLSELRPDPGNARHHTRAQVRAIAKSIEAFGFNAPILVDKNNKIIAGHGRYEAARLRGDPEVPVIFLDHLNEAQVKAYMLADNKLTDRSTWDEAKLAASLKELSELVLDFDITATGFEVPEIDLRIQSLEDPNAVDEADEFQLAPTMPTSIPGDLWLLGEHRLLCGNAIERDSYAQLMEQDLAAAVFTDPPYNVKVDGHVCGLGTIKHREFAMASSEMTEAEYLRFLTGAFDGMCGNSSAGALIYACMDWRHIDVLLAAGRSRQAELLNLCVWVKTNAGMGSFYRSQHELVAVFRNKDAAHRNNIQLGRFGRNRTNVWNYAGANAFPRKGGKSDLALHPTVKPIRLVSDAILDSTQPNDIILDPFIGSGTTILAAERTRRRCFGMEIDPLYVDLAIERWQRQTGRPARTPQGETYADINASRGGPR